MGTCPVCIFIYLTNLLYLIRNWFVVILRLTCRFVCLFNCQKQRWIIENSRRAFSIRKYLFSVHYLTNWIQYRYYCKLLNQLNFQTCLFINHHTVILPEWTFKKWGISNFAFQSFYGFIGTKDLYQVLKKLCEFSTVWADWAGWADLGSTETVL
jgi:hypothetical protein